MKNLHSAYERTRLTLEVDQRMGAGQYFIIDILLRNKFVTYLRYKKRFFNFFSNMLSRKTMKTLRTMGLNIRLLLITFFIILKF